MRRTVSLLAALLAITPMLAQEWLPRLAPNLIDTTQHADVGLQRTVGVETFTVFAPSDDTDHYANGVVMTAYNDCLYCMWQSSPRDEDSDDTRVAYSISRDNGKTWSKPQPLVVSSATHYFTSGGWSVSGDTLTAFVNAWKKGLQPRGGTTLFLTSTDGKKWSTPQPVTMADGSAMIGVLEQDPRVSADGIMVGAVHFQPGLHLCATFTHDTTGRSGWQRAAMEGEDNGNQSRHIEPSQYLRSDGSIVMLFRDQRNTFCKLASISTDKGQTWTAPQQTTIPDARTKQCAGNLSDGRAFMIACPAPAKRRWPLVLFLSHDGIVFSSATLLRSGDDTDLPARHYNGRYKTLGYSYPKAIVANGFLFTGYSVNKETVEVSRVPLTCLP